MEESESNKSKSTFAFVMDGIYSYKKIDLFNLYYYLLITTSIVQPLCLLRNYLLINFAVIWKLPDYMGTLQYLFIHFVRSVFCFLSAKCSMIGMIWCGFIGNLNAGLEGTMNHRFDRHLWWWNYWSYIQWCFSDLFFCADRMFYWKWFWQKKKHDDNKRKKRDEIWWNLYPILSS